MGTRTATCFPSRAARNEARIATSVLPNPASPQIRRSMGLAPLMSRWISSIALA